MTTGKEAQRSGPKVKHQIVAGFIIYRRTPDGIKFLLLYRRGNYWNFPKGHFSPGENALKTALRETEEETGLKPSELRIIPGFKTYVRFHFYGDGKKIFDKVILYLAETRQSDVKISPREHSGFAWFLYHDAIRILGKYFGTKRALKDAYDFIRGKSNRNRQAHPAR
ncbi:NUDIX domain-containing protein [Candidatus Parcubacteria bacterium]|nr:MAG: NUDIX domain-containing protein [Candidatus Parcubacteria bacterium]